MTAMNETIRSGGILPVVAIDKIEYAVPLAKAIVDAGLPGMEVTFRTACAADAIKAIRAAFPDLLLGAGTILSCTLADEAIAAGADFLVTPGFNPKVVAYAMEKNIPIYPGVTTPAEIEEAMEMGLEVLKFFPAEMSGGIAKLKILAGPYKNVKFIPTGGIDEKNFKDYLALDNVVAVGGSFMIAKKAMAAGNFDAVKAELDRVIDVMLGMKLTHVGINHTCEEEALNTAKELENAFHMPYAVGNSSIFSGVKEFELMKKGGRGTHGHISIGVTDIDRGIRFLKNRGVEVIPESLVVKNGKKIAIYLEKEIGGFAYHLMKM